MATLELTRQEARRIAVRAQLLDAGPGRPADVMGVVRHLGMLQVEPTSAVAPSADVVLWSRLGSAYDVDELEEARATGRLWQLDQVLRPAEDLALWRAEMAAWPAPVEERRPWQEQQLEWVEANDECRRDVLTTLRGDGPLPASALPDTSMVPWESSGWNNDRTVRMLIQLMVRRGEVALAGREGREPLWDLAERIYPETEIVPLGEARSIRMDRHLRSLGVVRSARNDTPFGVLDTREVGEPARIEGVRGRWRVDPTLAAEVDAVEGRVALLSPLDRLVFDRKRMGELFDFDYQLEMYKPVAKRRWGYWAMPVLHGDELVGKLDATADREAGVLRVDAVHEDGRWTRAVRAGVDAEIEDLAAWLGLALQHG